MGVNTNIMSFLKIITEPAIIIITSCFLLCILIVIKNYLKTENNLKSVYNYLKQLNKEDVSYRFQNLDDYMGGNSYTNTAWADFKKALIFPEKLYLVNQNANSNNFNHSELYLTLDSSYFFNEETLIHSKINHRLIQIMPTLLTGLGPFFTFLKMAIAFVSVDFLQKDVANSLNLLLSNIQIAALCSVFAVGYSLLFLFFERMFYNTKCKRYYLLIQKEFIRLFDICTSEQLLLDLIKESKISNVNGEKMLNTSSDSLAKAISKSTGEVITPYLDNILYSLNKLNENLNNGSNGNDIVDKLF